LAVNLESISQAVDKGIGRSNILANFLGNIVCKSKVAKYFYGVKLLRLE
jgi:hypothetical protein